MISRGSAWRCGRILVVLTCAAFQAELVYAQQSAANPLGRDVRAFLSSAARQAAAPSAEQVRQGIVLHRRLQADDTLPAADRARFLRTLAGRLSRWRAAMADRGVPGLPAASRPNMNAGPGVLAQVAPVGAGQPPAAGMPGQVLLDNSRELIELIEATIAPQTWDTVGGNGAVRYWSPGHALVVRQTGDVHEQITRLLWQLR